MVGSFSSIFLIIEPNRNGLMLVFVDKLTTKAQKITIKLPWEITTIYSEVLRQSGHQSDDEEDEDDIEAHEASIQRLKVRYSAMYSRSSPTTTS